ncbi:MAG: hypothetical protein ABI439_04950 [Rhodospirillales bacterium]
MRGQYGQPISSEKIYAVLSVLTWLSGHDEITLRWLDSGGGTGLCGLMQKQAFGG